MDQIERIEHMEACFDRADAAVKALGKALDDYQQAEKELKELSAYYEGELWRQDFEDDSDGKLPADLKRGVLSEDGVWNLLSERDELLLLMKKLTD